MQILVSIGYILRAGNGAPLNINAIRSESIKTYLKCESCTYSTLGRNFFFHEWIYIRKSSSNNLKRAHAKDGVIVLIKAKVMANSKVFRHP